MARPHELAVGNCYFLLNFYDSDLIVPSIQTLLFVGQEPDEEGRELWLFREPASEAVEGAVESASPEPELVAFDAASLYQVLDLAALLRELAGLQDFHPLSDPSARTDEADRATPSVLAAELIPEIERFLADPAAVSLTVTIAYTDDGFSISKNADAVTMNHFLAAKTETVVETYIRTISEDAGLAPPTEDYLANGGKTRILCFPIFPDPARIAAVGGRLLCEAYSMRATDTLDYHRNGGSA